MPTIRLTPDDERRLLAMPGVSVTPANPAGVWPRGPPEPPAGGGRSKYRSRRVWLGPAGEVVAAAGPTPEGWLLFDSEKECRRWLALRAEEAAGRISRLRRQEPLLVYVRDQFVCAYVADFAYDRDGAEVVEDCKSEFTRKLPLYRLKRKLVKAALGVDIEES